MEKRNHILITGCPKKLTLKWKHSKYFEIMLWTDKNKKIYIIENLSMFYHWSEWICNLLCSSNLDNNICIPIHRQGSKRDFSEWKSRPKTTPEWETYITYTYIPIIDQKKYLDHQVATTIKFFKMECCWPQNKSSIPVVDQEIGQLFNPKNSVFHSVSHTVALFIT